MDNIIRRAVQAAITILIPGGQLQVAAARRELLLPSSGKNAQFMFNFTSSQEKTGSNKYRMTSGLITCIKSFSICSFIWTPTVEIQSCITVLTFDLQTAELQTHFGPASECEGAEKEDEVDEEEVEFGPVLAPHADDSGATADPVQSAASPLYCIQSQEHQRSHHQLGAQLGRLKQETSRYVKTRVYRSTLKIYMRHIHTLTSRERKSPLLISLNGRCESMCTVTHTHTHKNVTNAIPPGLHVMPRSSNGIRQWDQSQTSPDLWHI